MKRALAFALLAACGSAPAPLEDDGHPRLLVEVGAHGYEPSEVHAPAGELVHLGFLRTSDEGCGQQVVFASLGDRTLDLPLNERVWTDVTVPASGRLDFTCGMGMYRGAIVAH